MVSPGFGKRSVKVVRSMLALPMTAMRGRFAIVFLAGDPRTETLAQKIVENAESIERSESCQCQTWWWSDFVDQATLAEKVTQSAKSLIRFVHNPRGSQHHN